MIKLKKALSSVDGAFFKTICSQINLKYNKENLIRFARNRKKPMWFWSGSTVKET